MNITLNGNSCYGFPMKIDNQFPLWPFYKFYDCIGKIHNIDLPNQHSIHSFKDNIIYCHKFEGEECTQGWIGVSLTHKSMNGFTEPHTLGECNDPF